MSWPCAIHNNEKYKLEKMKKLLHTLAATCMGMTLCCCNRTDTADYQSAIVNEDGTITFQYKNDRAKEVAVDVQFAGKKAMARDSITGLWTVTLGPAVPDMYPYSFQVDGIGVMDPLCDQYFPNEGFKNSLLEIPAKEGTLPHDIKDVPHGRMEYIHYYSTSLGGTNTALVYLPPSYSIEKEKNYPVFYLISGTTDTEEVYYKVGRVNYILDNLLAEGKAKEMIVVLPYGNPNKLLPEAPKFGMPAMGFGGDVFSNDLVGDLMPYIESHYRTINDRESRGIGGFSRGGNQGLSNGLHHLDKFAYLCSYSSFTSTNIPHVYDNADETNKLIRLFWLGVGTDDFLFGNARDYTEFLDQKGIRCIKEYTDDKFGHTWMNAKYFLSKTLPLLFNPEASEKAMQQATPTLPKTGGEPQFTAGVMARMFPRPIISPEYGETDVTFRLKAPQAQSVALAYEMAEEAIAMEIDSNGVWSITLPHVADKIFEYHFQVDGTLVCDPNNMYLSPCKGFKPSIAYGKQGAYYMYSSGEIEHGIVSFDYAGGTAEYRHPAADDEAPAITLVIGKNHTAESWMKVGNAHAMADILTAQGKCKPCRIAITHQPSQDRCIKADDYSTWPERIQALEQLLLSL